MCVMRVVDDDDDDDDDERERDCIYARARFRSETRGTTTIPSGVLVVDAESRG